MDGTTASVSGLLVLVLPLPVRGLRSAQFKRHASGGS